MDEAGALVRRAADRGVTLIDTADADEALVSDDIVGTALSGIRNRGTIETKFGLDINPETGAQRAEPTAAEPISAARSRQCRSA